MSTPEMPEPTPEDDVIDRQERVEYVVDQRIDEALANAGTGGTVDLSSKQDASTAATDSELAAEASAREAADALKQNASTAATDDELASGLGAKQDASTAATDEELASEASARAAADSMKQDAASAATDNELADETNARITADALKQDAATAATDDELTAAQAADDTRLDLLEARPAGEDSPFTDQGVIITVDDTQASWVIGSDSMEFSADATKQKKTFFDKVTGAFRSGVFNNANSNSANRGAQSAGFGTNPNASGTASFAAGVSSTASGSAATALGNNSVASGLNAIAAGTSNIASGDQSVAIGSNNTAGPESSTTVVGKGCSATGAASAAFGYYAAAAGIRATAIGSSAKANANDSVALGYQCEANGVKSVALGDTTIASGAGSIATGSSTLASGVNSTATGVSTRATAQNSIAEGSNSTADGYGSHASGANSLATRDNQRAFASGRFAAHGDAQSGEMVLRCLTTTATPAQLSSGGTGNGGFITLTGTSISVLTVLASRAFKVKVEAVARRTDVAGSAAGWSFEGVIARDATGNARFVGSPDLRTWGDTGAANWALDFTINTTDATNNYLSIAATGENSKTIRWVANLTFVEVA